MLAPLTARSPIYPGEQRVLKELVRGAGNDEIARRLFVSPSTVKTHVSHLLVKFAVPTRDVLIARFWANGSGWYEGEVWLPFPVLGPCRAEQSLPEQPFPVAGLPESPHREGGGEVLLRVHRPPLMRVCVRAEGTCHEYFEISL